MCILKQIVCRKCRPEGLLLGGALTKKGGQNSSVNYPDSTSNMCKNNLLGMSHCSELMPLGFSSLGSVRAVSVQKTTVCFLCAPVKVLQTKF